MNVRSKGRMRQLVLWLNRAATSVLLLVAAYILAAFVAAVLPANRGFTPPTTGGVEIFVASNGVHTDIVLPTQGGNIDWLQEFPPGHFRDPASLGPYVGFGWGDRGFYLETPNWSDLRPHTALKALFGAGPSVMHVSYRWRPDTDQDGVRALRITQAQFEALVEQLHAAFKPDATGQHILIPGAGYGPSDAFYESLGSYSPVNTCNDWAAGVLRRIGVRAPVWSPFDRGILANL